MQTELKEYYKNRATEFDEIYTRPERQQDIQQLTAFLKNSLAGKHVLEIACGTGFWTQKYSTDAASVLATDYNEAVLQVARSKDYSNPNIEFVADDAYSLSNVSQKANACYAGFWLSHVEKNKLSPFIQTLHKNLEPGSTVIFADNLYVEGNSTPISRQDAEGNTYQTRTLKDGTRHDILKNFITEEDFHSLLSDSVKNLHYKKLGHFWYGCYEL
ncbi:class I SAM-dependent methyltransferase [Aliamphritea spongicola]|uniref:class I SAM-dependent methyltransferase n=1 Tax=Aliamphritea spongicola TaxID=707589 RepID=UPI00196AE15D|nr:class I SAM-dependent methyltransferase [Aliamphritea spongicola]MBN3563001.1 methyltransferase domain-containing protein [Aliamphritea spongicola]